MSSVVEGIAFWDLASNMIVNFPKQHIQNGQDKNSAFRTSGEYKATVRMFKNARTYLANRGRLNSDVAPSYFVECFLFNAPDHLFSANRQQTMQGILAWMSRPEELGREGVSGYATLRTPQAT